jgi:hypothetical protein
MIPTNVFMKFLFLTLTALLLLTFPATAGPFLKVRTEKFRILEITPQGEPIHGKQTTLLRVAPHYGKIDTR